MIDEDFEDDLSGPLLSFLGVEADIFAFGDHQP
jgi:hypothetical protein